MNTPRPATKVIPPYNHSITLVLNVLNALIALHEHGPWVRVSGICGNLDEWYWDHQACSPYHLRSIVSSAMAGWPEAHNQTKYPVGGHEQYLNEMATGSVWENSRRRALLDYMIGKLSTGNATPV